MATVIDAILEAKRSVSIIGTTPLTAPECWNDIVKGLFSKTEGSHLQCTVISESDNQLFQHALRTDTPYAKGGGKRAPFTQLLMRKKMIEKQVQKANFAKSQYSVSA